MGVDFTAVIEHHFTEADLEGFPSQLARFEEAARAIDDYFGFAPAVWQSMYPPADSDLGRRFRNRLRQYVSRDGNPGLAVGHRCLYVHHLCRWRRFSTDAEAARLIRRLCADIARWAGTTRAIYLPDAFPVDSFDVVGSGLAFSDVVQTLRDRVGPPAHDISGTAVAPPNDGPYQYHYFIDEFSESV